MNCWIAYGYPDIQIQLRNERKQAERVQRRATRAAATRYSERAELACMIRGMLTRMRAAGVHDREIARRTGVSAATIQRHRAEGAVPSVVHADVFERISGAYVAFLATQPVGHSTPVDDQGTPDSSDREPSERGLVKLGTEDVIAVRARHAAGEFTRTLGDEFGVDPNTIRAIVNYRTWKHVLPDGTTSAVPQGLVGRLPFHGDLGDPVPADPVEKRHHNARLTPRQEAAIREEWALGAKSALIAERYRVSIGTVRKVCRSDDSTLNQEADPATTPHPWMQDDADRYAQIASRKGRRRTPELPSIESSAPAPMPDRPLTLRQRLAARRQRDPQDGHT